MPSSKLLKQAQDLEQALKLCQDPEQKGQLQWELADCLLAQKKYLPAQVLYQNLLNQADTDALRLPLLLSLAQCHEARGQTESATEIYQRALLALIPDETPEPEITVQVICDLANTFQQRQKYSLAISLYEKAWQLIEVHGWQQSQQAKILQSLSHCYQKLNITSVALRRLASTP